MSILKKKVDTYILGIESSCDDTSAAVWKDGKILSNCVANQEIHALYGGVVPEVASRAHQQNILPVVQQAIQQAGISKKDLSAIAFTKGPGLIGSLIVGVSFAKSLALALDIPLVGVNHMQAHIMAHFAEKPYPTFPFLCLTVSGGHTQIVKVNSPFEYECLGETLDDAAGEAFDKSGKLLGLDYPAGPLIDKLAKQGTPKFEFSKPRIQGLNFSFSGLKTGILYFLQREMKKDSDFITNNKADICASIQETIVQVLLGKLVRASKETGIKRIAIAGGVSANSQLREDLKAKAEKHRWELFIPKFEYCTDNAAMIAVAGAFAYEDKRFESQKTEPIARLHV
jgi:N6-L-threonylcarbamoyladenine synthase